MKKRFIVILVTFIVLAFTNSVALGAPSSEEENSMQQVTSSFDANVRGNESSGDTHFTEAVNIILDGKGQPEDFNKAETGLFAFQNPDPMVGSHTYIYEKPVTVTVRNSFANVFALISTEEWNRYVFEDTVTINIENSAFHIISGVQNYATTYAGYNRETMDCIQFKQGLVINVTNVKFDSLVGGMIKNNAMAFPPIPQNEMKAQIDHGIQINLTDIQDGEGDVVLGHCLSGNSYEPETVALDYYVKGDSSVNLVNSTVTNIVASRYQDRHLNTDLARVKKFAEISGNVSIHLDENSTVTGYLSGFPATKVGAPKLPASDRNGSTYEAHLNAKGALTLDGLGNFTHMNIASPIHVRNGWQLAANNGESVLVNFQDASKWKDGMDILTLDTNADEVKSTWLQKNWGESPGGEIGIKGEGTAKTLFIVPKIPPAIVTFQVVNGKWADNTTADQKIAVELVDGSGTLDVAGVPTGMIAGLGYDYGRWSATPNTAPGAITGDMVYTYTFYKDTSPGNTPYYTLRFDTNGGSAVATLIKEGGTVLPLTQVTTQNEYRFDGWYQDEKLTQKVTQMTLTQDTTVYAKWTKIANGKVGWNMDDHNAYIMGYPDGTIKPAKDIERSEVATILYSLMTAESRTEFAAKTSRFYDLKETMWYYTAATTLENAGILIGYSDGSFGGDRSITRAEFVTIFVRAYGDDAAAVNAPKYSDISDSWAKDYINKAAEIGLVFGDAAGTFRPNHNITRGEAISVINRFLERDMVDEKSVIKNMKLWPDNMDVTAWYYYDLQEASNGHDYSRREDNYETWTKLREVQILQ